MSDNPTNPDFVDLRRIGHEVQKDEAEKVINFIPMSPKARQTTVAMLISVASEMGKLSKAFGKWYLITHDDERARKFYRAVSAP